MPWGFYGNLFLPLLLECPAEIILIVNDKAFHKLLEIS